MPRLGEAAANSTRTGHIACWLATGFVVFQHNVLVRPAQGITAAISSAARKEHTAIVVMWNTQSAAKLRVVLDSNDSDEQSEDESRFKDHVCFGRNFFSIVFRKVFL